MEQTNLVVTPDGQTWDQVTRDTNFIGNGVLHTTNDDDVADHTTVHIFSEWRGAQGERTISARTILRLHMTA